MTYTLRFDSDCIRLTPTVWGFPFEIRSPEAIQRVRAINARADAEQWDKFVAGLADRMTRCLRSDDYPPDGYALRAILHFWEGEVGVRALTDKERREKSLDDMHRELCESWNKAQQEAFAAAEVAKDIRACPPN